MKQPPTWYVSDVGSNTIQVTFGDSRFWTPKFRGLARHLILVGERLTRSLIFKFLCTASTRNFSKFSPDNLVVGSNYLTRFDSSIKIRTNSEFDPTHYVSEVRTGFPSGLMMRDSNLKAALLAADFSEFQNTNIKQR